MMTSLDPNERAVKYVCRMWWRLARAADKQAIDRMESWNVLDGRIAVEFARIAEAAYWQSVGDCDTITLPRDKDFD